MKIAVITKTKLVSKLTKKGTLLKEP